MQDAVIVVGGVEMRYIVARVFFEVVFFSWLDIFILNFNIIVSIVCALHVMKAECCAKKMIQKYFKSLPSKIDKKLTMQKLVNYRSKFETTLLKFVSVQVQCLYSMLISNRGMTTSVFSL